MYDLQKITLRDMSECGLAIRRLGDNAQCMEEVSNNIIQYLYENFVDSSSSEKSSILIRFFKTHPYSQLTPDLQQHTAKLLGDHPIPDSLKCLTLLATVGEVPEWNSRYKSVVNQVIPLANEEAIAGIPLISQLIHQLGLDPAVIVQPDPKLLTESEQQICNVFYIQNALGSPYIPSETSFAIPLNIKSILGFGGLLPSGNMFTILMFWRVEISPIIVNLFRPLALNIKMALLPFDEGTVFQENTQAVMNTETINKNPEQTSHHLRLQIATLTQLLDLSEQSAITQSDTLEEANSYLEKALKKLQHTQTQLIQTEKMSSLGQMIAGIAHEINNPVNFINGNVTFAESYTESLLNLVELYQKHYPNPPTEIQQEIEDIDFDFMILDLQKTLKSMKVGTQRIREIILSLRNFSRLDESERKKVDIHPGIDSALMILEHRLKLNKNCPKIKVIKEYGDLPQIECYPGQLNQVFMNIISNAIDALEEITTETSSFVDQQKINSPHQLSISNEELPTIWIRTQVIDEQWITINIADNGAGIREEVRAKLFDPFFTTKPVGKGTGLGLSISYQIVVEKHGGQITCTSQPGRGVEFAIKIPILTTANI
jgi:two-component system, NtrC family, sensor kinase